MNDGGPAFPFVPPEPVPIPDTKLTTVFFPGMSLRDWFAGMAMQGFLADSNCTAVPERLSAVSYAMAEAMLKAREQ